MATRAPQGVDALPVDSNTGRLWGVVRRALTEQYAFVASTTTPFSGNTPAGVIVYDSALSYLATAGATGTGEFDMDAPTGIEFVISNNASGQTLSGITLTDYDTLPSGVSVPGQSYTTATNVATGATVTLSSLSLANNTAVRLWIPVSNAASRMWVVNPTYGAAVTIGTGNFEVRATPTFGSVSITGSSAPLVAGAPSAVATFPYSDITTASGQNILRVAGKLSRNARQRTFFIENALNEPLTSIEFQFYDSTGADYNLAGNSYTDSVGLASATSYATYTSEEEGLLATHVDSFRCTVGMGATLPTSGNLVINVVELF